MGVDFSHCDAHWAYSGFNRFRNKVAEAIGFKEYQDITSTDRELYSKISEDPILPLLAHSDCDGELSPEECRAVAPRLRAIVAEWDDSDNDKQKALELCAGMDSAADLGEPLEFR